MYPNRSRMTRITKMAPTRPPGRYPQDRLYPHVAITPRRSKTSRITKNVPSVINRLSLWAKSPGRDRTMLVFEQHDHSQKARPLDGGAASLSGLNTLTPSQLGPL